MKIYVGIDNSDSSHSVSIIDETGLQIESFDIENNLGGFQRLLSKCSGYDAAGFATELAHGPLIDFLKQADQKIFSLNPLKIKRFKENFRVSGNKNDQIDALALSRYLHQNFKHCRPMVFSSDPLEKLKVLGISYDRMIGEQTRMSHRLIFILKQYFPLLADAFANPIPRILLKMLQRYPVWRDLSAARSTDLRQFLIENRYRNPKFIDRFFSRIDHYEHCIPGHIESALSMEARSICRIILIIKDEIDTIKAEMLLLTSQCKLGKVFQSLPGVGPVLSGKLLGIIGDNKSRFTSANQMQSLFGTAPVNYQSGGYHKVTFRRACNKRGRATLYYLAFCTMRQSAWARSYYDRQKKKGKNHSVAVRALSNKWLSIIYAMWKTETEYDATLKVPVAA